jgi:hypothetical protein
VRPGSGLLPGAPGSTIGVVTTAWWVQGRHDDGDSSGVRAEVIPWSLETN